MRLLARVIEVCHLTGRELLAGRELLVGGSYASRG
jgi:hypothetical protein